MTVDELKPYGLEEMRDEEIEQFLEAESIGVLGLPAADLPYLVPLSYGYDGDSSLYFTYVLGETSTKERLTERAQRGQFLVYQAESIFSWRSVLLEGEFERVRPSEWGELAADLDEVWRPELFRVSSPSRNVKIYEFRITEQSGIKHTGLSEAMED